MAVIQCPICHETVEMKCMHVPPYHGRQARVAALIPQEYPRWNPDQGFCRFCEGRFQGRLEQRQRIAEDILEALLSLPPLEKQVFVLYHYRGLGVEDVCARLDVKPEAVRELLLNAARSLHQRLHRHLPESAPRPSRPSPVAAKPQIQ
jgi:DNA-directed RNA polymerase specialized sigma24 family protein